MPNRIENYPPTKSIIRYYKYIVTVQYLILGICFLFILDFNWLPTKTIKDQGIHARKVVCQAVTNGVYQTKNGFTFGTARSYLPALGNSDMEISYTPIFHSVKMVKTSWKDYTPELGSDLHSPSQYIVYFIALFTLCTRVALMKIQEPDEDTLWKIIISGFVILGICWLFWRMYN